MFHLDTLSTLVAATLVLLLGRKLVQTVPFLKKYTIPEPVAGGLLVALALLALKKSMDIEIDFDMSLKDPLMLAFFATIGLNANLASLRAGGKVLYLKQSDLISDFLTYLGAPVAAMGIMEAKLEKELNNKVNRCCNCDDANTSKVVEAAQEQLGAIRVLRDRGLLEKLPQKIAQAAQARENNPEASLSELAAMMEPPITKPAMNHRMKKIVSLAAEEPK